MGTFWACRRLPFGADEQRTTKFQLLLSVFHLKIDAPGVPGEVLACKPRKNQGFAQSIWASLGQAPRTERIDRTQ
jgi:hypothetical protein